MELFGRIRAELLRSGYVRTPVVYVHPANGLAVPKLQVRAWGTVSLPGWALGSMASAAEWD